MWNLKQEKSLSLLFNWECVCNSKQACAFYLRKSLFCGDPFSLCIESVPALLNKVCFS